MPKDKIKVSVLCLTYNQEKFIRQALDGFIMQKTNFAFEVLINDDASTDGTQKILKQYAQKYPQIIKPIFQKENRYSKGERGFIPRFLIPRALGDYLAICEGDDFWTSPNKLQLQVDFLDKHSDYSICFHPVRVFYEDGDEEDSIFPDRQKIKRFSTLELLKNNFIQTNSVMYRKLGEYNIPPNIAPADWFLHLYHAKSGKIGYIDQVMGAYRRHKNGVWWDSQSNSEKFWSQNGIRYLNLFKELKKMYGSTPMYQKQIEKSARGVSVAVVSLPNSYEDSIIELLLQYPSLAVKAIEDIKSKLSASDSRIGVLTKDLLAVGDERASLYLRVDELEKQIEEIQKSKIWKIKKLVGRKT